MEVGKLERYLEALLQLVGRDRFPCGAQHLEGRPVLEVGPQPPRRRKTIPHDLAPPSRLHEMPHGLDETCIARGSCAPGKPLGKNEVEAPALWSGGPGRERSSRGLESP